MIKLQILSFDTIPIMESGLETPRKEVL